MAISARLNPRTRALLARYCRANRITQTEAIGRGIALLAREDSASYATGKHASYLAFLGVRSRVAPLERAPGESDSALIRRKLRAKHRR